MTNSLDPDYFFHDLSPAEHERLAILAEECAETIHVVGKILRHGYESTHPDDPDGPNNRELLETEIGHVKAILSLMFDASKPDINEAKVRRHRNKKLDSVKKYLHHQL